MEQLLPGLSQNEYEALKEDIRQNGVEVSVFYDEDGNILDGNHRLKICEELGIDNPPSQVKKFDTEEAKTGFAIGLNVKRRHLSTEQYKQLAKKLKEKYPDWTQEKLARVLGVARNTISDWHIYKKPDITIVGSDNSYKSGFEFDCRYTIKPDAQKEIYDRTQNGETQQQIADDFKVSQPRIAQIVKKIAKHEKPKQDKGARDPSDPHVVTGDIFDELKKVPDHSIDVLITDPPYLVTDHEWDKKDKDFTQRWVKAVVPKLKEKYSGFIFCDTRCQFEFEAILQEKFDIKNRLIWIRKNMAKGRVVKERFISSYEVIFFFGNRELNFPEEWGAERFDSFSYAVPQSNFEEGKHHPTAKPIKLFERLIKASTFDGDTVLDCFVGSGPTGIVCKQQKLECYLIEKNPLYAKIANGRIADVS